VSEVSSEGGFVRGRVHKDPASSDGVAEKPTSSDGVAEKPTSSDGVAEKPSWSTEGTMSRQGFIGRPPRLS
jgi:hypothetical protein